VPKSDEEVEHLHAGEVSIEDGGELVEEEIEDKDDAVPLDAEDAARDRDLGPARPRTPAISPLGSGARR